MVDTKSDIRRVLRDQNKLCKPKRSRGGVSTSKGFRVPANESFSRRPHSSAVEDELDAAADAALLGDAA